MQDARFRMQDSGFRLHNKGCIVQSRKRKWLKAQGMSKAHRALRIELKPNPDKPELKIDPPEAERFMVSLRSVFSI